MLVKELIEKLQEMPQDMEVGYQWEEHNGACWMDMFGSISKISVQPVALFDRIVADSDNVWPKKVVLS